MSKFSGLLQAKQAPPLGSEDVDRQATQPTAIPEVTIQSGESMASTFPKPASLPSPRGKKGHPDYNQVTVYLKKETHNSAKISLLQSGGNQDFSELVEQLLSGWLTVQKSGPSEF